MERALFQRLLKTVADVRPGEAGTALMMFAYAFLAMTSYNIIQPLTRSKFISNLSAVNIAPATEMPTSAPCRDGASLMPSPRSPTTCPCALRARMMRLKGAQI